MSTVINNPNRNNGNGTSGGAGVIIGAVIVILVLVVAIIYALPYIRNRVDSMSEPANPTINVELPSLPSANTPASSSTPSAE